MILRLDGSQIEKDSLSAAIQQLLMDAKVSGLAVQIFSAGKVSYAQCFGFADAEKGDSLRSSHTFGAASFSKAVFGYLVAQLILEGKLDLDKPLQSYLAKPLADYSFEKDWQGFQDLKGDGRLEKITARMCLTHTTGLPNWRWIRYNEYKGGKLYFLFDPGERYFYSGEGIQLLQFAVEEIMGRDIESLVQEKVFQPLGMEMSSYLWQERFEGHHVLGHKQEGSTIPKNRRDMISAAGSLETSPDDYAKFLRHIFKLCKEKDPLTNLLFEKSLSISSEKQFGPASRKDTDKYQEIDLGYGLGWGLLKSPYGFGAFKEGHDDGFQHYSIIFPEKGIGIILMSNSENAESIFKEVLEISIGDIYTPWEWENYIPYNFGKE